ncbi:MAG: hypothetical protein K2N49_00015, partial [Ruminococcus sp.]|nr:hypothetical protein [Ruminococcus sp.]
GRVLEVDAVRGRISLTMRKDDDKDEKNQKKDSGRNKQHGKSRQKRESQGFDASKIHNSSFRIKKK